MRSGIDALGITELWDLNPHQASSSGQRHPCSEVFSVEGPGPSNIPSSGWASGAMVSGAGEGGNVMNEHTAWARVRVSSMERLQSRERQLASRNIWVNIRAADVPDPQVRV